MEKKNREKLTNRFVTCKSRHNIYIKLNWSKIVLATQTHKVRNSCSCCSCCWRCLCCVDSAGQEHQHTRIINSSACRTRVFASVTGLLSTARRAVHQMGEVKVKRNWPQRLIRLSQSAGRVWPGLAWSGIAKPDFGHLKQLPYHNLRTRIRVEKWWRGFFVFWFCFLTGATAMSTQSESENFVSEKLQLTPFPPSRLLLHQVVCCFSFYAIVLGPTAVDRLFPACSQRT